MSVNQSQIKRENLYDYLLIFTEELNDLKC